MCISRHTRTQEHAPIGLRALAHTHTAESVAFADKGGGLTKRAICSHYTRAATLGEGGGEAFARLLKGVLSLEAAPRGLSWNLGYFY